MRTKTPLFIALLALSTDLCAQAIPDLTGDWNGTLQVPGGYAQILYSIEQAGVSIEGFATVKYLNGRDSSKAEIKGLVVGKKIHMRTTKMVYHTMLVCLSKSEFDFVEENGQQYLRGKWKGDMGLRTCPPGVGGKIDIARVAKQEDQVVVRSPVPVAEEDQFGQALLSELQKNKYYALIVGIDQYNDPSLVHLDNPVKDAAELKKVLTTSYSFNEEDILYLKNPTRAAIIDAFDNLASRITDRDQLLIFYAGHGIWDEKLSQGYWLPGDASSKSKSQWLSNSTIRDYIGGINSKHTLLITDACFSGGIFKERSANFSNSRAVVELYKMPSRKAMTSGTLTTVPDQSVFVKYLIKNLQENDMPLISAGEIFQNFKIAVINNSKNGQVPQYGPIGQVGDEGGEFIFLRR